MALTEFHFILLYEDRVIGISNLNDHVVYEKAVPLVSLVCSFDVIFTVFNTEPKRDRAWLGCRSRS